ncbi:MAG: hypothetical protein DBX44_06620 [Oscillospiraceae bacterium]|nr:MAG: hypothetical protein DBX44_06620 [Oscillospiraceae bacterium]
MKRIGILLLSAILIFSLAACQNSSSSSSSASSETLGDMVDDILPDGDYSQLRTGLGIASNTAGSSIASADTPGSANFNVTVCALTLQPDGSIVDIRFDTVEAGLGFDAAGAMSGDWSREIQTNRELGDEYGIRATSGIDREWYEQIASLEDWMRGKMVPDVLKMKLTARESDGMQIPDEEDLRTLVNIPVSDQLAALQKAYADAQRAG